jgi:hypothetical protein
MEGLRKPLSFEIDKVVIEVMTCAEYKQPVSYHYEKVCTTASKVANVAILTGTALIKK